MKYFKDNQNNVYAYSEIQIPKAGLIAITEEEAMLIANPPPTEEQLATQIRAERDSKIQEVRWRLERARDEQDLGLPLTEPIEPILQYIQELRDIPDQVGFPWDVEWPDKPEMIGG